MTGQQKAEPPGQSDFMLMGVLSDFMNWKGGDVEEPTLYLIKFPTIECHVDVFGPGVD